MEDRDVLAGTWLMSSSLSADGDPPRAQTSFGWLEGHRFLIRRWRLDHPSAPGGIAIIGAGETEGSYRQHYVDSRGVECVYEMTLADGVGSRAATRRFRTSRSASPARSTHQATRSSAPGRSPTTAKPGSTIST
jgi:hypothetical protein